MSSQEELLNSIATALYSYQDFGLRLYDLYGLAKPIAETTQVIDLHEVLQDLNKDVLVDISEKVYTYAEWFDRFGDVNFPLKERKTFANFNMKEKLEAIELLNDVIDKAKQAVEYLDSLDHEKITPGYTWLIENRFRACHHPVYVEICRIKNQSCSPLMCALVEKPGTIHRRMVPYFSIIINQSNS